MTYKVRFRSRNEALGLYFAIKGSAKSRDQYDPKDLSQKGKHVIVQESLIAVLHRILAKSNTKFKLEEI